MEKMKFNTNNSETGRLTLDGKDLFHPWHLTVKGIPLLDGKGHSHP